LRKSNAEIWICDRSLEGMTLIFLSHHDESYSSKPLVSVPLHINPFAVSGPKKGTFSFERMPKDTITILIAKWEPLWTNLGLAKNRFGGTVKGIHHVVKLGKSTWTYVQP